MLIQPLNRAAKIRLLLIVALLLIASYVKLSGFLVTPPGMHPDTAEYVNDGLRISRTGGQFPLYFDTRPEPLWRYVLAGVVLWTNAVPFANKLAGNLIGILTVAVSYRAAFELLRLWPWCSAKARILGALICASAVASTVSLQFITRQGYRAGVLPLGVAFLFLVWARVWRKKRGYFWAGVAAGFPINIYIAGVVAPAAALGSLIYMVIFGRRTQRPSLRQFGILLVGLIVSISVQGFFFLSIPNLYSRVQAAQVYHFGTTNQSFQPLVTSIPDLLSRLENSAQAFYRVGHFSPSYNASDTPFLNPLLALLAFVGLICCLLTWRRLPGVLTVSMLVVMMLPGALSEDPLSSIRLVGTFVPLAILSGFGAAGLMWAVEILLQKPPIRAVSRFAAVGLLATAVLSPVYALRQFNDYFQRPDLWQDPTYWLSIPHYYSINFTDYLTQLQQLDRPAYVPIEQANSSIGVWYLWSAAYPNVTTLDVYRDSGHSLPSAELWYPYAAEYNEPLPNPAKQFVLLVPGENGSDGTQVILPPIKLGEAAALRDRAKTAGTPIINNYGWTLGWRLPVDPNDVLASVDPANWFSVGVQYANSLELVGYEAPRSLKPGQIVQVVLYWKVLRPINFDLFTYVGFLNTDNQVIAPGGDNWVYHWLHPSMLWQPGEIVPENRIITLPAEMPQGAYKLGISAYTPPAQHTLPAIDPNGQQLPPQILLLENHRVPIDKITIPANAVPINAAFGGQLILDAYSSSVALSQLVPGTQTQLHTFWHGAALMDQRYTLFVHVENETGEIVAQQDILPMNGQYPTNVWNVNEPIQVDFSLTIPANATGQHYRVYIGAYSFPSLERLPVTQDGQPYADRRARLVGEVF